MLMNSSCLYSLHFKKHYCKVLGKEEQWGQVHTYPDLGDSIIARYRPRWKNQPCCMAFLVVVSNHKYAVSVAIIDPTHTRRFLTWVWTFTMHIRWSMHWSDISKWIRLEAVIQIASINVQGMFYTYRIGDQRGLLTCISIGASKKWMLASKWPSVNFQWPWPSTSNDLLLICNEATCAKYPIGSNTPNSSIWLPILVLRRTSNKKDHRNTGSMLYWYILDTAAILDITMPM